MLGDLFVYLYPCVTIISVFAYIPQIKSLIYTKSSCEDISLASWYLWIFSTIISTGYGVFHLQDMMFSITCIVSLILMLFVVGLVLYRRAEWKENVVLKTHAGQNLAS